MSFPHACIGMIGGMSPQSTITYYRTIIDLHFSAVGDHSYPRILIGSIPFQPVNDACHEGDWVGIRDLVQVEGDALAAAGADFLMILANTPHKVVPDLSLPVPLLTVYDAVAKTAKGVGFRKIGLTGTGFTMSDGFYQAALEERGLEVVLPSEEDRETIHRIIYDELVSGLVRPESQEAFAGISLRLAESGADVVLLGCTELELLTRDRPLEVPSLDTTFVHAEAAWKQATGRAEYPLIQPGGAG